MIAVESLHIESGAFTLRDITFTVPAGSHAVLMGKSGCGKTTILEVIAGLRKARTGLVKIGPRDVTALPPAQRGIGYVPQDLALFPHLTVEENLRFALDARGIPDGDIRELASWLGITPLLARKSAGLSGGEAQRVALGRALAFSPAALLLDEPLSALDDATREEMRAVLKTIRERTGVTTLHVTHHRDDARALADIVLELADGKLSTVRQPC